MSATGPARITQFANLLNNSKPSGTILREHCSRWSRRFPDGRRVALIDASVLEDSSLSDADVLYDRSHPRELVSEAQTEFLEDKNG